MLCDLRLHFGTCVHLRSWGCGRAVRDLGDPGDRCEQGRTTDQELLHFQGSSQEKSFLIKQLKLYGY
jgi:hypothetical protein